MRDILNKSKATAAMVYAARTGSANGATIDTRDFGSLLFVIQLATVTTADSSNYFTFSLEHSDDSGMSGAVAVTPALGLLGANIVVDESTVDNDKLAMLGYSGAKRYVRLVATETGTASAAFSAVAIQQHAAIEKVGDEGLA